MAHPHYRQGFVWCKHLSAREIYSCFGTPGRRKYPKTGACCMQSPLEIAYTNRENPTITAREENWGECISQRGRFSFDREKSGLWGWGRTGETGITIRRPLVPRDDLRWLPNVVFRELFLFEGHGSCMHPRGGYGRSFLGFILYDIAPLYHFGYESYEERRILETGK